MARTKTSLKPPFKPEKTSAAEVEFPIKKLTGSVTTKTKSSKQDGTPEEPTRDDTLARMIKKFKKEHRKRLRQQEIDYEIAVAEMAMRAQKN
jgi:hypothetical protein